MKFSRSTLFITLVVFITLIILVILLSYINV